MIPRKAADSLRRLEKGFPVLCITGPRQSGKTTLAKACYPNKPYLSLEDPDIAALAREDPRGLLDTYRDGLILDEIQAVPEVFTYLKTAVDADPRPGKYIVTGSQQFSLIAGITESLAGRAARS
ncbi:MAG: AAA family ATPase, partial [Termitinemataceae bacterium]